MPDELKTTETSIPDRIERIGREREWSRTDLGRLFIIFENRVAAYWQVDGQENASDKRLRSLHDAMRQSRYEFLAKLRGW